MPDVWKDNFRKATFRTTFTLALSQPQIEMLCAVADGVMWNRSEFMFGLHMPDSWIATQRALTARGLIVDKTDAEREREFKQRHASGECRFYEWNNYRLTPAGAALVELFKVTGIFVESDAAIRKKSRRG